MGQHRGTGWIHTQGGAGGSCCPVPHTAHPRISPVHTHTHTPECRDLLLPWGFSKLPLDTALGAPAWPNRDISAQEAPNQLLIQISEQEERKEPEGTAWRITGNHPDDPASCGMSLFDFCPSFPHTSPTQPEHLQPLQPQGSVCPRKRFLWTLGGTSGGGRSRPSWDLCTREVFQDSG